MNKKFLATVLAFSVCSVPFAAYAEDVTGESLLEASSEASKNVSSMSLGMGINMDAALEISSNGAAASSFGIAMNGDFDVKTIIDPMQLEMTGTYNISVMGQTMAMDMDMYMIVSEDGSTVDTYAKVTSGGEDSGWEHQRSSITEVLDMFGVSSLDELQDKDVQDLMPEGVELDWNVEEGDENYTLSTALMFSQFMPLIEASIEASGETLDEETMGIVESLMDSLGMNLSYSINKESSLPVSMHMDFNNSDLSVFDALITALMTESMTTEGDVDSSDMQCRLILNDLSVDADYTYDDVTEITVPADALATEAVDPTEELQEVLDEALEAASEAAPEA